MKIKVFFVIDGNKVSANEMRMLNIDGKEALLPPNHSLIKKASIINFWNQNNEINDEENEN